MVPRPKTPSGAGDAWRAGYEEGRKSAFREIVEQFKGLETSLRGLRAESLLLEQSVVNAAKRSPAVASIVDAAKGAGGPIFEAMLREIDKRRYREPPTGETPAQKSARQRRVQRMVRDEHQAAEMAVLIREGHTTESARQKMGIGVVRSQRIRAVAVRLGLIEGRKRKA